MNAAALPAAYTLGRLVSPLLIDDGAPLFPGSQALGGAGAFLIARSGGRVRQLFGISKHPLCSCLEESKSPPS